MKQDEIQAMKDKIDQEARYTKMVNDGMNYREGFNLWFIGLMLLGIIIGFFIGRI